MVRGLEKDHFRTPERNEICLFADASRDPHKAFVIPDRDDNARRKSQGRAA
jgi:hypothetical protein